MCESKKLKDQEFDYIIIGTGLGESILSACLSHIGRRVLHVDFDKSYGSDSCTLSFDEIIEWINESLKGYGMLKSTHSQFIKRRLKIKDDLAPSELLDFISERNQWTEQQRKRFRKSPVFDLNPKLVRSLDYLVQLLARSKVHRYCCFNLVNDICCLKESGKLEKVPFSRSEVFTSESLSMRDKRSFMKFSTDCLSIDGDLQQFETLGDALTSMTPKASDLVANAICMSLRSEKFEVAVDRAKRLIKSSGKFGPSPLLVSAFGQSDICQGFCRFAAVHGATYYLGMNIKRIKSEQNRAAMEFEDENGDLVEVFAKSILVNQAIISEVSESVLTRCIFVRSCNVLSGAEHSILFYSKSLPPVYFIEKRADSSSSLWVVYGSCEGSNRSDHIESAYNELCKPHEHAMPDLLMSISFEKTNLRTNEADFGDEIRLIPNCCDGADFFFKDPDLSEIKSTFETLTGRGFEFDCLFPDNEDDSD